MKSALMAEESRIGNDNIPFRYRGSRISSAGAGKAGLALRGDVPAWLALPGRPNEKMIEISQTRPADIDQRGARTITT
jgi:hypothetical protein